MAGLLSRERIIAQPGFNRWLVPPAALAIHLSIGMAYGFSVFWLPLSRAIGITEPVPCPERHERSSSGWSRTSCDWKISHARLDVHPLLRLPRLLGRGLRALAGARRAAQGGRRGGVLLGRRVSDLRARRAPAPDLADVARLRRDRRLRAGPGLHLAGVHADQVVPRPARHGDRHGDHGLRRRRDDRGAARRPADEALRDARRRSAWWRRSSPWARSTSWRCWPGRSATGFRRRTGPSRRACRRTGRSPPSTPRSGRAR